ncbi:hypothetical protein J6590_053051 [Homalodisca vitripennis]|nr:hypothetical protein J6590_053051 [Homalodisca vitripennis]
MARLIQFDMDKKKKLSFQCDSILRMGEGRSHLQPKCNGAATMMRDNGNYLSHNTLEEVKASSV